MLELVDLRKTFVGSTPGLMGRRARGQSTADHAQTLAIDGVSLQVTEGELFTLLGPSGCGKTTTLRSVAGLETPDSGEIRVGDRVVFSRGKGHDRNVPANRRRLGMVFQSYAIWPHMTVFENAAFPLRVLPRGERPSKAQVEERVMRVLTTLELDSMAGRPATKLSGGQQQRLALARALAVQPALMLLDEPLSNLDARLRESLRLELKRLQHELGITSIYVTHDQVEALAISSRIAVMSGGRIMQVGEPRDIYLAPANRFVAEFIGKSNIFDATVRRRASEDTIEVESPIGLLAVRWQSDDLTTGSPCLLAVRPESIGLMGGPPDQGVPNGMPGRVVERSFLGDAVDHIVAVGDRELLVRLPATSQFPAESRVTVTIDPASPTVIAR
ncbi:MAG: ABC transporter ATP-binding protein [Chloroflexi bacterium]|nr:ABC transporter ATP-binding protein [Chloroflexota bacterium]